ncbi:serine/threonine-protein kinase [Paracoccus methylarcula]|uniref:Serine/threonine protein kinase n=1 Tax=Paracoccus methylarcula TaxID=72022 RepID=A0A422QX23_9RHOB|nr:serine/threonine-protein kinase [Paracoccus methylarcula]RNF34473.1 serine/threonine protein kinase [Paracoccus methylarcula]
MTDQDDPSRKTDPPLPEGESPDMLVKPAEMPDGDAPADDRTVFADAPEPSPEAASGETVISDEPQGSLPSRAAPEPTVMGEQPEAQGGELRLVEPGTLINNNYRILSLVSAGGMGEVYRAENVFTGDPVAVKVILPNLARDEAVLDLFRREARVLVQLRDEAIVRYHNFVLDGGLGRYCLIMEFVEGRHLGTRVKEDGPLADDAALTLMRRLARGLDRAHARGVTHRDLSPDNVILRDDHIDEAVLIDFGIARSTELGDGLAGRFAGKFKYIAPEQLGHAGGEIGPRTDVYGLALLMAMVVRGKPLDMGDSVVSASAARQAIPDLSGISHRLFPLLQHMLEPDPQHRPEDMRAVLRMLNDPATLPSRYRLPLWSAGKAEEQEDNAPGSFPSLTGDPAKTDSDSPFALAPGAYSPRHETPTPQPGRSGRSGWIVPASAVLAVAAVMAGAGTWWMTRDNAREEVPVVEAEKPRDLVARDSSTREGFLASQPLPDCSFADRIASGQNAGMISVLGRADSGASELVDAYEEAFGVRPAVVETQVAAGHCPALNFLREVSGRPAVPPELTASIRSAASGFQLVGKVSSDAERNLWLFLVSPDGRIYDLTGQSREVPGGRSFGVGISAPVTDDDPDAAPFLLAALTTGGPITAVAAAPSGAPAAELLPRVLDELRANGENPAVSVLALQAEKPEEPRDETPEPDTP